MPNLHELENAMPVAPLKIIALPSAEKMGRRINDYMVEFRKSIHNDKVKNDPAFHGYIESNYLVDVDVPRFGSGEAKAQISETIRGKDLFILTDVCNHSITYNMNGYTNHMSPDDHYQDLKRVIAACNGKARRINVIMPFLYEGRQHRRSGRESLDCAYALEELRDMGIDNFITFDAHDPRVQNSTPLNGFDNFTTPYQFIKSLLNSEDDMIVDKDHLLVISPDEGALDRAIYFASVLGVDTGMFYKRRDYSTIVNGKNTANIVRVEAITEIATSFVACTAACFGWLPRSIWVVTFSNTTIASSTTMPIAIESELNEIMFNVLPEASK